MPLVVWVIAGLIGYRATVHTGEAVGEAVVEGSKSALPYVAAGFAAYLIIKRVM